MRKLVAGALVVGIIIGMIVGLCVRFTKQFAVYGISSITVTTELEDGVEKHVWRIYGSTDSAELILSLKEWQVNQTLLKQYGAMPKDYALQSAVIVKIERYMTPYWMIDVVPLESFKVTTKVAGESSDSCIRTEYAVDETWVTIWKSVPTSLRLYIPFKVQIYKKYPSGDLQPLKLSNAERIAEYYYDEAKKTHYFAISDVDWLLGNVPKRLVFYNPYSTLENVTLTLTYPVGVPSLSLPDQLKDFIVVTEKDSLQIFSNDAVKNMFVYNDLNKIEALLSYNSTDPWKFSNYWFGDPNDNGLFGGHTVWVDYIHVPPIFEVNTGNFKLWGTDKGEFSNTIRPVIRWYNIFGSEFLGFVAEGEFSSQYPLDYNWYKWLQGQPWAYEYPGWYSPQPNNTEGATLIDPWNWRLPIRPQVYSDLETRPHGLSMVNYLQKSVTAPVSGKTKPADYLITSIDVKRYWSYEFEADKYPEQEDGFVKYYMPPDAFAWQMILDVDADIVDEVKVVTEQLAIPKIISLEFPEEKLLRDIEYQIKVSYKNTGPRGEVATGIIIPRGCPISVVGGDRGYFTVEKDEVKNITLKIMNSGGLTEDKVFNIKVFVANIEEITDSRVISLTVAAGVGVPETEITIYTYDADTKNKISGINVQIVDSATKGGRISEKGSSDYGLLVRSLGYFEGEVIITAHDPAGVYEDIEPKRVYVGPKTNPNKVELYMVMKGASPQLLDLILKFLQENQAYVALTVGAVGAGAGVYVYKKSKERAGVW